MQFCFVFPQHSFSRSVGISLQYVQMHQLGAVLLPGRGCSGSPLSIASSMSRAKEGCFAHTSLRAVLSPSASMFEIHSCNDNYLLYRDM